ncbi:tRNA (uridine(34)/cytosine(34)/5-carboxymethylaminomethyluridine(34)-2'-O)-methyltransferase TrmL [Congregibacter litoralis]|uniref:tRNA (cytidine(34)-2'-O)-methyltransferase n=1 Tax=Congregibacter litoralis KT71 TaxID=314285 RepID=A4A8S2_9GAMM|nr:tRNA (uridine(34)/cytosine(34)/5-carboxymethylaminomethyluridine(34)-2'-O)-methyltransferase TrmL [Congregibacter litoralis]EAQ97464.1 rRNA methylase, putative, group 2 [Congregibacter litoralis KT71]
MLHVALYEPEIPPNTGNIMRLCANTSCPLHLIKPLGFSLEDKQLRRAGLDYREFAHVQTHDSLDALIQTLHRPRIWTLSTRGTRNYTDADFQKGDVLLFGPETRGLPATVLDELGVHRCLRVPMYPDSRSLNLSNAAALVLYEGLRQQGFPGMA